MTTRVEPHETPSPIVRFSHLVAALVATCVVAASALLVLVYTRAEVRTRSTALAPDMLLNEWEGRAASLAIMRRDDLLPVYGSSELIVPAPNRATDFFASYPTGFAAAPIGARGYPMLSMAVAIGSLGEAVRGHRIVISLSGTWLAGDQPGATAINFQWHQSTLQTGDLLFRSGLPLDLRRRFAERVLGYVKAKDIDPLLAAALNCHATRCLVEPLLPALAPLWLLESLPRRTRDYVKLRMDLVSASVPVRQPIQPDWKALELRADSEWTAASGSNQFGIEDSTWHEVGSRVLASQGSTSDSTFVHNMVRTPDWQDLDLLLATLKALGARPLILSSPLKGAYWNYRGVSASARERMYQRFDSVTAQYGFPARSFSERDSDVNFLSEPRSHLSGKGWLVYDRTINAFYHDSLQ